MTRAIALFSGGLDSILACRVVARQGIQVLAVKFVTPFFDYDLLHRPTHPAEIKEKYGIDVMVRDVSEEYLALLRAPAHGYGKHFNPCLDCKIFMMTKARKLMSEFDASFLISGEVVGQRPMSQRRDALRVVERDSGCDSILLRPLCAKHLDPTTPELEGVVDRDLLCDFSGRARNRQIALAREMGITDYPTPAGGCVLTDPTVSQRIRKFYEEHDTVSVADMRLLLVGRQFILPGGSWLAMGRNEQENDLLLATAEADDSTLILTDRPGPTAVLRNLHEDRDLHVAAGLVTRYGKKGPGGVPLPGRVQCKGPSGLTLLDATPPAEDQIQGWQQ